MTQQAKFSVTDWGGTAEVLGHERRFGFRANGGRLSIYGLDEAEAKLVLTSLCLGGVPALKLDGVKTGRVAVDRDASDRAYADETKATAKAESLPQAPSAPKVEPIHPAPAAVPVPGAPEPVTAVAPPTEAPKPAAAAPEPAPEPAPTKATRRKPKTSVPAGDVVQASPATPEPPKGNGKSESPVLPGEPDPWKLAPDGEPVDDVPKSKAAPVASSNVPAEVMAELQKASKLSDVLGKLIDAGFKTQAQLIQACFDIKAFVPILSRVADLQERIPRALTIMGHEG